MSGIVFFKTQQREKLVDFYTGRVGADVWLEQPDCTILTYAGFRFGFCQREETDACGMLTFLFEDRTTVDAQFQQLKDVARGEPQENETYDIYQFFVEDPDGRLAEFQTFLHETPP